MTKALKQNIIQMGAREVNISIKIENIETEERKSREFQRRSSRSSEKYLMQDPLKLLALPY